MPGIIPKLMQSNVLVVIVVDIKTCGNDDQCCLGGQKLLFFNHFSFEMIK